MNDKDQEIVATCEAAVTHLPDNDMIVHDWVDAPAAHRCGVRS